MTETVTRHISVRTLVAIAAVMTVFALVACSESPTSSPVASSAVPLTTTADQLEPTSDVPSNDPVATLMPVPAMVDYTEVENWSSANTPGIEWANPNGIAIDSDDNVYTTEFMGNRIRKFSPDGEMLLEWGGPGSRLFKAPTGVAVGPEGNIFISESGGHHVQKFTPNGEWLLTLGSHGDGEGQFNSAMVLTISDDGLVYVTDWGGNPGCVECCQSQVSFFGMYCYSDPGSGRRIHRPGRFRYPAGKPVYN